MENYYTSTFEENRNVLTVLLCTAFLHLLLINFWDSEIFRGLCTCTVLLGIFVYAFMERFAWRGFFIISAAFIGCVCGTFVFWQLSLSWWHILIIGIGLLALILIAHCFYHIEDDCIGVKRVMRRVYYRIYHSGFGVKFPWEKILNISLEVHTFDGDVWINTQNRSLEFSYSVEYQIIYQNAPYFLLSYPPNYKDLFEHNIEEIIKSCLYETMKNDNLSQIQNLISKKINSAFGNFFEFKNLNIKSLN